MQLLNKYRKKTEDIYQQKIFIQQHTIIFIQTLRKIIFIVLFEQQIEGFQLIIQISVSEMQKGTKNNPIDLESDQQDFEERKKSNPIQNFSHKKFDQIITCDFDACLYAIREQITGDDQKKNQIINKRLGRYWYSKEKIIDRSYEYIMQRRQPIYTTDVQPVPTELIIYGVDFLSVKQVRAKYKNYKLIIKYLDDSHYRLIFEDQQKARQFLENNIKNTTENIIKLESQEIQIPRGWFQLQSYQQQGYQRKLTCRYATSMENDEYILKTNLQYKMKQVKIMYEQSCVRASSMNLNQLDLTKKFNFQQKRLFKGNLNNYSNHNRCYQKNTINKRKRDDLRNIKKHNIKKDQRKKCQQSISDRSNKKCQKGRQQEDNLSILSYPISQISQINLARQQLQSFSIGQEILQIQEKKETRPQTKKNTSHIIISDQ